MKTKLRCSICSERDFTIKSCLLQDIVNSFLSTKLLVFVLIEWLIFLGDFKQLMI
ncbi:hypothetical protein BCE_A0194 (plasmid) [Bacillus cereus ATCC 10987]|uniref:Uncharacterized protein n=1 Tax=Bacillus cereus (strain ATCC 10987 / NRS 248) TaxID=222523 RepID=Q74NQ0_BACC1|nr:hypothetical protein BCE_A0194 [Bacillus cereus ATCC 10987]